MFSNECFHVNFAKFFRTTFLQNIPGCLLKGAGNLLFKCKHKHNCIQSSEEFMKLVKLHRCFRKAHKNDEIDCSIFDGKEYLSTAGILSFKETVF